MTVEGRGALGPRVSLLPPTGRTHGSGKWSWAPLEGGRLGSWQRWGGLDSLLWARIPGFLFPGKNWCHVGRLEVEGRPRGLSSRDGRQKAKSTCLAPGAGGRGLSRREGSSVPTGSVLQDWAREMQAPGPGKGMLVPGLLASPCPQAVRLVAVPGGRVARR